MEITAALALGRRLMREHGLEGWTLTHDQAKTRAGVCRYDKRTISLSRPLTHLHADEAVRDTILHEIAHALVGPEHAHDAVWQRKAREIGSSGERCVSPDLPRVDGDWLGRCDGGHEVRRHRRPRRVLACSTCGSSFRPEHILTWTYQGRRVGMGSAYATELAELRRRYPLWAARTAAKSDTGARVIIGRFGGTQPDASAAVGYPGSDPTMGSPADDSAAWGPPLGGSSPDGSLLSRRVRPAVLRVGGPVRVLAPGRFQGAVGEVEFVGATKVQVRLHDELYSIPREILEAI